MKNQKCCSNSFVLHPDNTYSNPNKKLHTPWFGNYLALSQTEIAPPLPSEHFALGHFVGLGF